ncbi:hypothetical protein WL32_28230 [Burkholderia cepacia]|uniref:hypothetical protein n=1 Tax=Burkholderia cepacia TaxID=292 RepID=UPI0007586F16|nr:hypothetical protein [Burkholderia cepacia]KWB16504.1 hypothetical protein WL32_28230 [Burkholderia cepacia]
MINEPKLDRNLNLVFEFESGTYAYVQPISQDLWRSYRVPLAIVLDEISTLTRSGVTVAADLFREACEKRGVDAKPFFSEIRRCTSVGYLTGEEGFATVPFAIAKNNAKITDEEVEEIENFFAFWQAALLAKWARGLCLVALGLAPVVGTSSTFTDFLDSLQTSTPDANTDAKTTAA